MKLKMFSPDMKLKSLLGKKPYTIKATNKEIQYCIGRKYSGLVQRLDLKEIRQDDKLEAEDKTGKIVLKGNVFKWVPSSQLSEEEQEIVDILNNIEV